jgi:L-histidine Nalpha-methyltransferase
VGRVDVHLQPDDLARALRVDARAGLTSVPKELPPKYFYDDRGSRLFDEITRLPEYYLTRCEREILETRADEIAQSSGADTLVELGSGTSEKTRILLDALCRNAVFRRFVPFDVSEGILREAAERIDERYPRVEVHAVVGDFEHHLPAIPNSGRRLIALLGSTIGNFAPEPRKRFLADLAASMGAHDSLLVGFDLVKDTDRLQAAYNDTAGVTAEFNRNVLHVLNRELDADFELERFEHCAWFDPANERIEMLLISERDQRVRLDALDLDVTFDAGEAMRTEISAKFRRDGIEDELAETGLELSAWWTDAAADFALALIQKS